MTLPTPHAPVSWGELFDKATILELKCERGSHDLMLRHAAHELALLKPLLDRALSSDPGLAALVADLQIINGELWDVENRIREKEAAKAFDADFIGLARAVYHTNDRRAALKKQINARLGSEIVEQKNYSAY